MPYKNHKNYQPSTKLCTVYLLHFSEPFGHARHYVGVTSRADVNERLAEHRSGRGARLCAYAVAAGIKLILARTWEGVPRFTELKLKGRGKRKICPLCIEEDRLAKNSRLEPGREAVTDPGLREDGPVDRGTPGKA